MYLTSISLCSAEKILKGLALAQTRNTCPKEKPWAKVEKLGPGTKHKSKGKALGQSISLNLVYAKTRCPQLESLVGVLKLESLSQSPQIRVLKSGALSRSPQVGVLKSESSSRSPQVGVLKSESSSRSPQVGVLKSGSSSRSPQVGILSQSPQSKSELEYKF